ncbi:sulfotransferase family protein [Halalkalibaculum sp. DA3122]|uniref:sulfotransferase family protein n=1 Tax=unclassified Halalkalibaculum TaxID=2964617 RepID=UPI0037551C98
MNLIRRKKQEERTHLLILGLPRSGTSLLASLLGAHSKASVICEDFGRSWMDVLGKPVVGNKLCVPRQIDLDRRRTIAVKLANRLGLLKRWPKSTYSINDYLIIPNLRLILIERDPVDVRNSIQNRGAVTWTGMDGTIKNREISTNEIDYTIDRGTAILDTLKPRENARTLSFKDLINQTDSVLKDLLPFIGLSYEEGLVENGTRWNWMYPKVSEKGIDADKA